VARDLGAASGSDAEGLAGMGVTTLVGLAGTGMARLEAAGVDGDDDLEPDGVDFLPAAGVDGFSVAGVDCWALARNGSATARRRRKMRDGSFFMSWISGTRRETLPDSALRVESEENERARSFVPEVPTLGASPELKATTNALRRETSIPMKTIRIFALVALAAALAGIIPARADSTQLQAMLDVQRQQMAHRDNAPSPRTTVAVYADHRSLSDRTTHAGTKHSGVRYDSVTEAHGQSGQPVGAYVPADQR